MDSFGLDSFVTLCIMHWDEDGRPIEVVESKMLFTDDPIVAMRSGASSEYESYIRQLGYTINKGNRFFKEGQTDYYSIELDEVRLRR